MYNRIFSCRNYRRRKLHNSVDHVYIININNNSNNKSKDRHKLLYFIILGFLIVSFIINAAAPGNSVRAEGCNGMPAIKAIIMSILYSGAFIGEWTHLPQIVFSVFITPFLFNTARNTNYKFKHPFIAVITSFLCFATQFTPTLFAMGSVGAGRQRNIYYYSYYLLVIFNIFYICGVV